jgi:hypothetical protein
VFSPIPLKCRHIRGSSERSSLAELATLTDFHFIVFPPPTSPLVALHRQGVDAIRKQPVTDLLFLRNNGSEVFALMRRPKQTTGLRRFVPFMTLVRMSNDKSSN